MDGRIPCISTHRTSATSLALRERGQICSWIRSFAAERQRSENDNQDQPVRILFRKLLYSIGHLVVLWILVCMNVLILFLISGRRGLIKRRQLGFRVCAKLSLTMDHHDQ